MKMIEIDRRAQGCLICNELPTNIGECKFFRSFKLELKICILDKQTCESRFTVFLLFMILWILVVLMYADLFMLIVLYWNNG